MSYEKFPEFLKENIKIKGRFRNTEERLYEGRCKVHKDSGIEYIDVLDKRNSCSETIGNNPRIRNKDRFYDDTIKIMQEGYYDRNVESK